MMTSLLLLVRMQVKICSRSEAFGLRRWLLGLT
jgi:hypothetical protein